MNNYYSIRGLMKNRIQKTDETKYDRLLKRSKNIFIVTIISVIAILITGLDKVTESLNF